MSKHPDPVTGDEVSFPEYATILAQGVIRRWTILLIFAAGTATCWILDKPTALLWWNLTASFYAIVVESIVGQAQFSQTRRDAAILRNQQAIVKEIHTLVTELREFGKNDLQHTKDDLAIDLDSNRVLYNIVEHLEEIKGELGVDE